MTATLALGLPSAFSNRIDSSRTRSGIAWVRASASMLSRVDLPVVASRRTRQALRPRIALRQISVPARHFPALRANPRADSVAFIGLLYLPFQIPVQGFVYQAARFFSSSFDFIARFRHAADPDTGTRPGLTPCPWHRRTTPSVSRTTNQRAFGHLLDTPRTSASVPFSAASGIQSPPRIDRPARRSRYPSRRSTRRSYPSTGSGF